MKTPREPNALGKPVSHVGSYREMKCPYSVAEKLLAWLDSAHDVWTLGLATNSRPARGDADALPPSHFLRVKVNLQSLLGRDRDSLTERFAFPMIIAPALTSLTSLADSHVGRAMRWRSSDIPCQRQVHSSVPQLT